MVFSQVVEVVWITKFHIQQFFRLADTYELLNRLLDLLPENRQRVYSFLHGTTGLLWTVTCFFGTLVTPFNLDFLDLAVHLALFFENFLLERRDLLIHRGAASLQDLLERGPLTLNDVNPKPVRRVDKALLRKQLLTRLASVQLDFPLRYDSLHFLNLSDEQGDILGLFE